MEISSLVNLCASTCVKDHNLLKLPAELREVVSKYMEWDEQSKIFSEYRVWHKNGEIH